MKVNKFLALGLFLVVAGFFVIALGTSQQGSSSAGGFILIGPFPIVFGTGTNGGELALLSVILGVLMIVFLLVAGSRLLKLNREQDEN